MKMLVEGEFLVIPITAPLKAGTVAAEDTVNCCFGFSVRIWPDTKGS